MTRASTCGAACALLGALLGAAACRESVPERAIPGGTPGDDPPELRMSGLSAGGARVDVAMRNPYAADAMAVSEGRTLYNAMNCGGCHGSAGGGGIGPPLADADWIYGGQPENVVAAILRGRPDGMPSFGAKLAVPEAWKIAAYVATLHTPAADANRTPAPSR
ncbi:MAG: c-type cytochrome [Gemmatirosa sp.]